MRVAGQVKSMRHDFPYPVLRVVSPLVDVFVGHHRALELLSKPRAGLEHIGVVWLESCDASGAGKSEFDF